MRVTGLTVRVEGAPIVDKVSLSVRAGDVFCLLGPSGCGKSSTLRAIAGLVVPDAGAISIDGELMSGDGAFLDPEHRNVGLVFQDQALFPHLTVLQNVAFGLQRLAKPERAAKARQVLETLGMAAYADRYPATLSGGEKQRVAIARALAPRPALLLLDEPFSGLDGSLRTAIQDEMMEVLAALETTVVIVTHDPEEAMRLGDRIGVMHQGQLLQVGSPTDIYERPNDLVTAQLFSSVDCFPGTVHRGALETAICTLPAPGLSDGTDALLGFRPRAIGFEPVTDDGQANARVLRIRHLGDHVLVEAQLIAGPQRKISSRVEHAPQVQTGDAVRVRIDPDRAMIFRV
ncbi:MAG: ABC transporter ATP-binding protein [Pseudomonadota bacterium]